ncbi:fatty acid hydroxylase superfamily protein [Rhodobiaceae bacterium]|nr:fatty acid hydroxylase superfamily protein [Rhodobiaceae bacterium]
MKEFFHQAVRYGAYPMTLLVALFVIVETIGHGWGYGVATGFFLGGLVVLLIALEMLFPMKRKWKMTWASFLRDLKYITVGACTTMVVRYGGLLLAFFASVGASGPLSGRPFFESFIVALLVFEFFQYWHHRLSHEMSGAVGGFLWRIHAAHHLPDKVYVLMHAVGHPLNDLISRHLLLAGVVLMLGASPEVVFAFGILTAINGTFSHLNVDIRAGGLNYFLVSTELHRHHHSADRAQSKNYGATIPFWDQVFGTFVYDPGVAPDRLGVDEPDLYPQSNSFWQVMKLPFVGLADTHHRRAVDSDDAPGMAET